MSSKKSAKQSASSAPATEKARKAAQAEIQKRIDAIESGTEAPSAPATTDADAPAATQPATKPKAPKATKTPPPAKPKRVSALDAAASILATAKEPMRAKEIVADMATQGLWKSPGGLTPEATLYAAMLREIKAKGPEARFIKSDRGLFSAAGR